MKYSDYLLNVAEAQRKYCLQLNFPEDDIRTDFHGMVYDLTHNYYHGYIIFELAQEMVKGNVTFGKELYKNKIHIDAIIQIAKVPLLKTSYLGSLNKQMTIGVWTAFETSVSIIAEAILTMQEKEELFTIKKDEVLKLLDNKGVDAATLDKISKKLTEKHLSQIPLVRKFRKILNQYEGQYSRTVGEDVNFIEFYGKMRNTLVHSNGIYHGPNSEFKFKGYTFLFENGKLFKYTNDPEMLPRLHVELASNLSEIYIAMTDLLKDKKEILYPDTGIYWEE